MNSVNNYFNHNQSENKENLIRGSTNSSNSLAQGNSRKGIKASQKSNNSMAKAERKNECVIMRDTVTQTEFDDVKI